MSEKTIENYPHKVGDYVYFVVRNRATEKDEVWGGEIQKIDKAAQTAFITNSLQKYWIPLGKCVILPKLGDFVVWNKRKFLTHINNHLWGNCGATHDFWLENDENIKAKTQHSAYLGFDGLIKERPYWGEIFRVVEIAKDHYGNQHGDLLVIQSIVDGQKYYVNRSWLDVIKR